MRVELQSFGRKYGVPEADIVFDVRCMDNPYWVPELREKSGLDAPVREYILRDPASHAYLQALIRLMSMQTEMAARRGCDCLRVAVGCTGGRHRSVTAAILLADALRAQGWTVCLIHRDLERG